MKFLIVLVAVLAVTLADDEILKKSFELNDDGTYNYEYQGNGISASESGQGGVFAKGLYEYTGPEGEQVSVQYTADENGYQPTGTHIHQIPEYITRALEYIKTHPHPEYQNE